ncbi:hypothetical protein Pelo_18046 [Pelomyxa schiedti]|nr:hypothetical protein Pelo_18046 [Pelomyxa schiedti]
MKTHRANSRLQQLIPCGTQSDFRTKPELQVVLQLVITMVNPPPPIPLYYHPTMIHWYPDPGSSVAHHSPFLHFQHIEQ